MLYICRIICWGHIKIYEHSFYDSVDSNEIYCKKMICVWNYVKIWEFPIVRTRPT